MSVVAGYDRLVTAGSIDEDQAQRALAVRLDELRQELDAPRQTSVPIRKFATNFGGSFGNRSTLAKPGFSSALLPKTVQEIAAKFHEFRKRSTSPLARLFGRRSPPVTGLYIYGPVGRGKSMLMDLFVATCPAGCRRVHFHAFMAEVHERLRAVRQEARHADHVAPVADGIAAASPVLCFDEFAVNDIGDAMILGRLFTRLFDLGVVVVATSNVAPDDLYAGGLNRRHFLPFIALLKQRMEVVELQARTDFRLEKLASAAVYVTPLGPAADRALDAIFNRLTGGQAQPDRVQVGTRAIHVPEAGRGVARFEFTELCDAALGARDFLAIGRAFHTVFLEGVPVIPSDRRDIAKRFITLVDTFYECRVKLVVSAAVEPDRLYRGRVGAESFEFSRTVSRLNEMRSEEYLSAPRMPPPLQERLA